MAFCTSIKAVGITNCEGVKRRFVDLPKQLYLIINKQKSSLKEPSKT